MINQIFNDVKILEQGLDASWLRNQVINNNIANVDTPGFKSSKVEFESIFKRALSRQSSTLKKTREGHIDMSSMPSNLSSMVVENNGTSIRMDGNNVDIDYESAELARNQIYYNTLVQQMSSEMRKLSLAINGGK